MLIVGLGTEAIILYISIFLTSRSLLGGRIPRRRRLGDGDAGRHEGDEREEVVHCPRPDCD